MFCVANGSFQDLLLSDESENGRDKSERTGQPAATRKRLHHRDTSVIFKRPEWALSITPFTDTSRQAGPRLSSLTAICRYASKATPTLGNSRNKMNLFYPRYLLILLMAGIIIERINSRCFRRTGAEAPSLLLAATGIGPDREPNGR